MLRNRTTCRLELLQCMLVFVLVDRNGHMIGFARRAVKIRKRRADDVCRPFFNPEFIWTATAHVHEAFSNNSHGFPISVSERATMLGPSRGWLQMAHK